MYEIYNRFVINTYLSLLKIKLKKGEKEIRGCVYNCLQQKLKFLESI